MNNIRKSLIILLIVALSSVLLTCSHTGGTATVTINLGFPGHESAHNQSFIDRLLGLFLEKAYAQPPTNIESILVRVTGPGMSTIEYGFEPTVTTITVVVPAGKARTISVIALVSPSSPSAALAFTGTASMDLSPGEVKSISVTMIVSETKIVIPDPYSASGNLRLIQINYFGDESSWISINYNNLSSLSIESDFRPWDVDFDSRGRIYIANNVSDPYDLIIRIDDMTCANETTIDSQANNSVTALGIDRGNNLLYYISNGGQSLYMVDLNNTSDNSSIDLSEITYKSFSGIDVDNSGYVYISNESVDDYAVYKIDPNAAIGSRVVASYKTNLLSPKDVVVKQNYVYVADYDNSPPYDAHKILQLTMNLGFAAQLAYSGQYPMYGPRRFVAILNRRIYFIDEDTSSGDQLVAINDISGDGWDTYGSNGSGVGKFRFYTGC